jgi:hypothetical protein
VQVDKVHWAITDSSDRQKYITANTLLALSGSPPGYFQCRLAPVWAHIEACSKKTENEH